MTVVIWRKKYTYLDSLNVEDSSYNKGAKKNSSSRATTCRIVRVNIIQWIQINELYMHCFKKWGKNVRNCCVFKAKIWNTIWRKSGRCHPFLKIIIWGPDLWHFPCHQTLRNLRRNKKITFISQIFLSYLITFYFST